jgi:hypothetical protein
MAKQRDKTYGADPTTITLMVACFVGICVLYSLEFVYRAFRDSTPGKNSLLPSWRAASSWLSLVALTAFATGVHIPWYAVVLGCAGFGSWAYRRTRAATLTLT